MFRASTSREAHVWAPQLGVPGGVAEPLESPSETVVREVREETGLDVEARSVTGYYYEPAEDLVHFVGPGRRSYAGLCALGPGPAEVRAPLRDQVVPERISR